jgi:hypothetical protein
MFRILAILLKAEKYWSRPERLAHRTFPRVMPNRRRFSSSVDVRKIMNHFADRYARMPDRYRQLERETIGSSYF